MPVAVDNIMNGIKVEDGAFLTNAERLQLEMQGIMDKRLQDVTNPNLPNKTLDNMGAVSDAFAGITNSAIQGTLGDRTKDRPYYWYDVNGEPTNNQQVEFFAEMFSQGMVNNADAIANVQHYLPTASKDMEGIMEDMLSRVSGG